MIILNKEPIEIPVIPEWAVILTFSLFCALLLFVILSNWSDHPRLVIAGWVLIMSITVFQIFAGILVEETDRMRYECTLDDTVSFTEIYEKYDVVERRGEIWVLEDKEE